MAALWVDIWMLDCASWVGIIKRRKKMLMNRRKAASTEEVRVLTTRWYTLGIPRNRLTSQLHHWCADGPWIGLSPLFVSNCKKQIMQILHLSHFWQLACLEPKCTQRGANNIFFLCDSSLKRTVLTEKQNMECHSWVIFQKLQKKTVSGNQEWWESRWLYYFWSFRLWLGLKTRLSSIFQIQNWQVVVAGCSFPIESLMLFFYSLMNWIKHRNLDSKSTTVVSLKISYSNNVSWVNFGARCEPLCSARELIDFKFWPSQWRGGVHLQ